MFGCSGLCDFNPYGALASYLMYVYYLSTQPNAYPSGSWGNY